MDPRSGAGQLATGYGLGLMTGTMRRPGMARPLEVAGHSAGGPGSVGAVYRSIGDNGGRTIAVFPAGSEEGVAEDQVLQQLIRT